MKFSQLAATIVIVEIAVIVIVLLTYGTFTVLDNRIVLCVVAQIPGKYYYEATVTDEGLCRVGWSTLKATLDLGTDKEGFGFGGTGKKSFGRQFDTYGEVCVISVNDNKMDC